MASRKVGRLGLPQDVANRLTARGVLTAGDVLFRTDLELMVLLDLPLPQVQRTRERVSRCFCPPSCTVLDLVAAAGAALRLPTQLPALDAALGGGLPCGCVSELVGPSGLGKSQMCLMLAVMAALPPVLGGWDARVVLLDTENKFSARRLQEIASAKFPQHFSQPSERTKLAERVLVISPSSADDLLNRLKALQGIMVRDGVRLVLLDSAAALTRSEFGGQSAARRQEHVGQLAVLLKELAEGYGIPVVVTNQVSGLHAGKEQQTAERQERPMPTPMPRGIADVHAGKFGLGTGVGFLGRLTLREAQWGGAAATGGGFLGPGDMRWEAALGVKWAHAVNVRLVFDTTASSAAGLRSIHIAKAPMAPPFMTHFFVGRAGLEELHVSHGSEDEEEEEEEEGDLRAGYR